MPQSLDGPNEMYSRSQNLGVGAGTVDVREEFLIIMRPNALEEYSPVRLFRIIDIRSPVGGKWPVLTLVKAQLFPCFAILFKLGRIEYRGMPNLAIG